MMTNTMPKITETLDRIEDRLPPIATELFSLNRAVVRTSMGFAGKVASSVGTVTDRVTDQLKDSKNTVTGTIRRETQDTAETMREEIATKLEDATQRVDSANPATDYESMTREALYQIAQDVNLDGRSSMAKSDLIKALERL